MEVKGNPGMQQLFLEAGWGRKDSCNQGRRAVKK
jgi:hypothetical protein